jgi:glycerol transport system ATP-binding protein
MIYVTHDQTEALTFADQVVVMKDGEIVQIGTPVDLFERPQHTFVGHFIGSPGMNVMPCEVKGGKAIVAGVPVETWNASGWRGNGKALELGVRPEFVTFAAEGIPVEVVKVADAGRYRIVETQHGALTIKMLIGEDAAVPSGSARVAFDPEHSQVYEDGWIVSRGAE